MYCVSSNDATSLFNFLYSKNLVFWIIFGEYFYLLTKKQHDYLYNLNIKYFCLTLAMEAVFPGMLC